MDTVQGFEDLLELFETGAVRYLILGGLAFIYHAKPRFATARIHPAAQAEEAR